MPNSVHDTSDIFLGILPREWSYSIAGQLSWINLIYEVINEAIILPVYFFTGSALTDKKAFANRISGSLGVLNKDFVINYQDLQGIGMTHKLALPTLIPLCSIGLGRPVQSSMVVIGDFSIGGTIMKAENLASTLQVCLDSGAKKILLAQTSAVDLGTVPAELMSSFSLVFYQSAEDDVFKALGVE